MGLKNARSLEVCLWVRLPTRGGMEAACEVTVGAPHREVNEATCCGSVPGCSNHADKTCLEPAVTMR